MSWPKPSAPLSQEPHLYRLSRGAEFGNETACSISRFRSEVIAHAPNAVQTPSSRLAAHNASTEATSALGTVNSPNRVYSPMLAVTS
jgi:hypothetical protein